MLADLAGRGVRRLMVEGGTGMHTAFLTAGLADELHLVIAPFFVGDTEAPRFVHDGRFPWDGEHGARRWSRRAQIGNVALHRYLLSRSEVDRHWLGVAVELSRQCPPSADGVRRSARSSSTPTATCSPAATPGTSTAPCTPRRPRWPSSTPTTHGCAARRCTARWNRAAAAGPGPRTCTELILAAGIPRVVFALREPATFVDGQGAELLAAAGVEVVELPDLADAVREVNRRLL